MSYYPQSLEVLIEQFASLPSIGPKNAQRLAFHCLNLEENRVIDFAKALVNAKKNIHKCKICQTFTEKEVCSFCSDSTRNHGIICVVEKVQDVYSIDNSFSERICFHVLHNVLSPKKDIGTEQINVDLLIDRVKNNKVDEVIMALGATIEGETTALYLAHLLKDLGVKVTRLAYGIGVGTELDCADDVTLAHALMGRSLMNE